MRVGVAQPGQLAPIPPGARASIQIFRLFRHVDVIEKSHQLLWAKVLHAGYGALIDKRIIGVKLFGALRVHAAGHLA